MVDPISAAGGAAASKAAEGAANVATSLAQRVLGPSADIVGEYWAEKLRDRLTRTRQVAEVAGRRIKDDDFSGAVPLRVANRIFNESEYCDDEFVREYLGGVLASSKTSRDMADLGNTYASYISHLAVDHLRAHYRIYAQIQRLAHGKRVNWQSRLAVSEELSLQVTFEAAFRDFCTSREYAHLYSILRWLQRENLLILRRAGTPEELRKEYDNVAESAGIALQPTALGVELYMWGLGRGARTITHYLLDDLAEYVVEGVELGEGYCLLRALTAGEMGDRAFAGFNSPLDAIRSIDPSKLRIRGSDDME